MTIQRLYSLPNCTLILEGLSDGTAAPSQFDLRPAFSILMSAECRFIGQGQPLTGGRDFFESLVKAVSSYAQEFLSGVPSLAGDSTKLSLVQLHRINDNLHRLTVQSLEPEKTPSAESKPLLPTQIDLTTVQLFDLVEAVDQFFADSQTLPELSLQLAPVSKRHAKATEPIAKRALPAAVGMSSLALAAIAFFFVPIPEIQRPKDPVPQPNVSGNLATPTPSGAGTPNPNPTSSPDVTPSTSSSPTSSSSPTASSSPMSSSSPTSSPLSAEELKGAEANAPKITDSAEIEQLSGKLYEQINTGWKSRQGFEKDLTYRVTVAQDGAIVGYKSISPEGANEGLTPLPQLLYKPVGSRRTGEPLADFRVVFTTGGVLQVSRW
ncbi:DUF4335 domain-containing protein [Kamptonema sp. UHCC 0994]|uniref:DUF4335 domain-containing protein n=1 Tax=Kamptonema sp. UHCC 0994 TaxID=3031329 RepID=UPI0023BA064E|nr:DUF4335 domain-containing protein [Kamptonema sp. UHCC 0994]MDF0554472.1 DUF4335 domain-containing protein [Kamptonema sp. UHCC 0994]